MTSQGPIDDYLDELLKRLHGPATETRRVLSEAEAHLRDAADAAVTRGLDPTDAEQEAITAFGSPGLVASTANRVSGAGSLRSVCSGLAEAGAWLGVTGLLAIGVSGPLAWALSFLTGKSYVFGLPRGSEVAASTCAHWMFVQPAAATCQQAGMLENADDALVLRVAAGVLGLLGLAVLLMLRRWPRWRAAHLPPGLHPAIGATVFGGAGVVLLLMGVGNLAVSRSFGAGQWLVDATISLVVGACYLVFLLTTLRTSQPSASG
ncbi:MAG: permease prefix domain 1-containing protein [Nocardioidaceae bacterium]